MICPERLARDFLHMALVSWTFEGNICEMGEYPLLLLNRVVYVHKCRVRHSLLSIYLIFARKQSVSTH